MQQQSLLKLSYDRFEIQDNFSENKISYNLGWIVFFFLNWYESWDTSLITNVNIDKYKILYQYFRICNTFKGLSKKILSTQFFYFRG